MSPSTKLLLAALHCKFETQIWAEFSTNFHLSGHPRPFGLPKSWRPPGPPQPLGRPEPPGSTKLPSRPRPLGPPGHPRPPGLLGP